MSPGLRLLLIPIALIATTLGGILVTHHRADAARAANESSASAPVAEVVHPWTSRSERAAVRVLEDEYVRRGGEWKMAAVAGFENARAVGLHRIMGGKPPTGMHAVAGPGFDDLDEHGLLTPISELVATDEWSHRFPPLLVASVSRKGRLLAIPHDLHTQNWLLFSLAALRRAGVQQVPTTWPAMFQALDKVKETGGIPIALGGQGWQENLLFNAVLISIVGKRTYEKVYAERDIASVLGPDFYRAVDIFGRLRDYVDRASPGRNWNDATQLVISNRAAFQVIGDWALADYTAAGKRPGTDFGCAIGFDDRTAIIGSDVVLFPRTTDRHESRSQVLLAQVLLDVNVQHAFAQKLGTLPARLDASLEGLHPCTQKAAAAVRDNRRGVPSPYMELPNDVLGDVEDVVSEYWNDRTISADSMIGRFANVLRTAT
jgi:glucose/mannose transport system substrate-binding protein